MKTKTKKRIAGSVALLSAAMLLLTGTFAWQDFRQHSTNLFNAKDQPEVRLNDDFKPPASWNTTVNSIVDKKVSVSNTQNSSSPVFVRVRFSEYMESFDVNFETFIMDESVDPAVPVLFATYASGSDIGEYLVWDTQQECIDGLKNMGLSLLPYDVDHDNDGATAPKWFARTQNEELQNGVYGKAMCDPAVTQARNSTGLYGGIAKQALVQDVHDQTEPNKTPYKVHKWDGSSICNEKTGTPPDDDFYAPIADDNKKTISDYIKWEMGADVVTFEKWKKDGSRVSSQWVLAEDGWCYWLDFLPVATTTTNLMETVNLFQMPDDAMEYEIHIDMQAITAVEFEDATVWPELVDDLAVIKNTLKDTIPAMVKNQELQNLIKYLRTLNEEDYTPESWIAMINQLNKAEILAADPQAKNADLVAQIGALETAKTGLVSKANKTSLGILIEQIKLLPKDSYTASSWSNLQQELARANTVMADAGVNQTQVNTAYTRLSAAVEGLVAKSNRDGLIAEIIYSQSWQESDWNAATWAEFNAKLTAAISVRDNSTATSEQIRQAQDELIEARIALRSDKTELTILVEQVKAFSPAGVDPNVWAQVSTALENAKDVLDTDTSPQSAVDVAYTNLMHKFLSVAPDNTKVKMLNGEEWQLIGRRVEDGTNQALMLKVTNSGNLRFTPTQYSSWEGSEIRATLRSDAYMNARFTPAEKALMATVTTQTPTAWNNGTLVSVTGETLFLLSEAEATAHMTQAERKTGAPWWLRSPRDAGTRAGIVDTAGSFNYNFVYSTSGVRPAFWVNL